MRTGVVVEEYYEYTVRVCQHSTSFVLNDRRYAVFFLCVLKYTCDLIVIRVCMNSTISTLSCPRKQLLAFWQTGRFD
jgi:hypothetical protein